MFEPTGIDGGFYCKRSEGAIDLAHATTESAGPAEQKVTINIGYLALERLWEPAVVRIFQIASGCYVMLFQHPRYQDTY